MTGVARRKAKRAESSWLRPLKIPALMVEAGAADAGQQGENLGGTDRHGLTEGHPRDPQVRLLLWRQMLLARRDGALRPPQAGDGEPLGDALQQADAHGFGVGQDRHGRPLARNAGVRLRVTLVAATARPESPDVALDLPALPSRIPCLNSPSPGLESLA